MRRTFPGAETAVVALGWTGMSSDDRLFKLHGLIVSKLVSVELSVRVVGNYKEVCVK